MKRENVMELNLTKREEVLLVVANIKYTLDKDYSEAEMLELLDLVRDQEVAYSNYSADEKFEYMLSNEYAALADKIQGLIPEY